MDHASRYRLGAERLLAGYNPQLLPPPLVQESAQRWRTTFAMRVFEATGAWTHAGYDWHAFSYRFVAALEGNDARSEYARRRAPQPFLALFQGTMTMGFCCEGVALPYFERSRRDVYVVPADFSWTMVFTHEGDQCGPYFTTPDWVKAGRAALS